jgi:hypothetical protein
MRTARDGIARLLEALRAEGGTVADVLTEPVDGAGWLDRPGPAQMAAAGPRASENADEYELLLEMILEGSRLHYGEAVIVRPRDSDLALLLGDQLYALGLSRLAALGDIGAVSELADVISLVAQAHAVCNTELAEAVWEAGAVAVGWGPSEPLAAAKELARVGDPGARDALRAAAAARRLRERMIPEASINRK